MRYRDARPLQQRLAEAHRVLTKYPDHVPVIVESGSADLPNPEKCKFLVPRDTTAASFMAVVRKRFRLQQHHALFLFVDQETADGRRHNFLPPAAALVADLYTTYKDQDCMLHCVVARENTFG